MDWRSNVFFCITISYYHNYANFIRKHWACVLLVGYILSNKCLRISTCSQWILRCIWGFFMIVRILGLRIIIIIKSAKWRIWYYLGLGSKILVFAVCLFMFEQEQCNLKEPRYVQLCNILWLEKTNSKSSPGKKHQLINICSLLTVLHLLIHKDC